MILYRGVGQQFCIEYSKKRDYFVYFTIIINLQLEEDEVYYEYYTVN